MPTYEYQCSDCGFRFELLHSMTDNSPRECPVCSGSCQKLISAGSGFIMRRTSRQADRHGDRRSCSQETPCCGRAERCDKPPCHS